MHIEPGFVPAARIAVANVAALAFAAAHVPRVPVEPILTLVLVKALLPFADAPALRLGTALRSPSASHA